MASRAKSKPKPRTMLKPAPTRRAQLPFRRSDVTRACRAVQDANVPIGSIVIEGGRIIIVPKSDTAQATGDLDQWMATRGKDASQA
jgi:hypothetical protein